MNYCQSFCRTIQRLCNSGAAPLLPAEYQQVEYLRSTGTQYINTNFIPSQQFKIDVTGSIEGTATTFIFGVNYSNEPTYRVVAIGKQNGYYICPYWSGAGYAWANIVTADDNVHTFTCDWVNKNYKVDNNAYTISGSFFSFSYPLYLFSRNNNGAINYITGKIYRATIYDSQLETVNDFIPCYRKSDSKPGMYDTVTKQFFTNSGTGEFILGQSVGLPFGYQRVKYLESTSGEYIKTGFVTTRRFKSVVSGAMISSGTTLCLMGNLYNSGDYWASCGITKADGYFQYPNPINTGWTWGNIKAADSDSHTFIEDWTTPLYTIDATSVTPTNNYHTYNNVELYMFGANRDNTLIRNGQMRIEHARLYDSQLQLVRDYVPCYRKSDNKPGMYDIINDTFNTNFGTGEFTLGPSTDVPSEYQKVEYLQSTGNNWIDTGVVASETLLTTCDLAIMSGFNFMNYSYVFGTLQDQSGTTAYSVAIASSTTLRLPSGNTFVNATIPSIVDEQKYTLSYREGETKWNGTQVSTASRNAKGNMTLWLFSRNTNLGETYTTDKLRIYHAQLGTTSDVAQYRDLYPCYRKADNVTGMYDLVTRTFIPYSGTENFITGNKI